MPRASGKRSTRSLTLSLAEARGVALAAQGLDAPAAEAPRPGPATTAADLTAMIERLGIVQIDTISVVARSQYLVLWSRLGAYPQRLLEEALSPRRDIFEYWSHAASILPMRDYPYYRGEMLRDAIGEPTGWHSQWVREHADVLRETLATIRERGPMASADFENPTGVRRAEPWEWYGPKDSRRALDILWLMGDLMVHSRRAGQKVFDLRERVLAEAYGATPPAEGSLPDPHQRIDHFTRQTTHALGIITPSWLWDYYRLGERDARHHTHATGNGRRARAQALLDALAREGALIPARIEGLDEPAYLAAERFADVERLRGGEMPARTTLLSPFDSLIWDRARARALFGYEVCFEAYVVPEKRRYGYYCLAILHRGRLVGRIDPKFERRERRLIVRALHLEPGVTPEVDLLDGLAGALRELAAFLGAETVTVERADPAEAAPLLAERVA